MSCIRNIYIGKNIGDWNIKVLGEFKIALISTWHGHHCASTIACKYVVPNPNGNFVSAQRMNRICPCKHTCDVFYIRHPISLRSASTLHYIVIYRITIIVCGDPIHQCVFGC